MSSVLIVLGVLAAIVVLAFGTAFLRLRSGAPAPSAPPTADRPEEAGEAPSRRGGFAKRRAASEREAPPQSTPEPAPEPDASEEEFSPSPGGLAGGIGGESGASQASPDGFGSSAGDDADSRGAPERNDDEWNAPAPAPSSPDQAVQESPVSDDVSFTTFAPQGAAPETDFLIQVWVHADAQIDRVRALAGMSDDTGEERPSQPLAEAVERGARLQVSIEGGGLQIDEPVCTLIWRGEPVTAHFKARLPSDISEAALARVRVFIADTPVGSAIVRIARAAEAAGPDVVEVGARRYRTAFLSYARDDLPRVLEHHQSLAAVGLEVFQDVLGLEPGERWERKLFESIDQCDVFLIYWSSAAAQSEFVQREIEHALAVRNASPDARPDIIPVVLETPPPLPPESLADIHFDDPIRRLILATS